MVPSRNRILELLKAGATLNGIDYVEVREAEPTGLYVHFVNTVAVTDPALVATIAGGDVMPTVPVAAIVAGDWSADAEGRPILRLTVPFRGDYSAYTLRIDNGTALDPYFREVQFSFFAFCPSTVDCQPPPEPCPPPGGETPAIDYLAKDYDSFRRALSDFSALRYPEWRERGEADFGTMMLEALSAVGDELSDIQDRHHRQAQIATATERDALVRLARLVDYEPSPVVSAHTELQCDVSPATPALPAGITVTALAPDGSAVPFTIGRGIRDSGSYVVSDARNFLIKPYWWDDRDRCLKAGSTTVDVAGHGRGFAAGQRVLIDTEGPTPVDPHVRQIVTLAAAGQELTDPLFAQAITRLTWSAEDVLLADHDLTRTTLGGNIVPATQGVRRNDVFAIFTAPPGNPTIPRAVARLGADSMDESPNWVYRYTLSSHPLAFLPAEDGTLRPEIVVTRIGSQPREWAWVSSLLEAGEFEEKFTVDAGAWRTIGDPRIGCADYDGSAGTTVRFGDSVFGARPLDTDVFEVRHCEGRGAIGGVPADAITGVEPAWAGALLSVFNPFPAAGAADAETDAQIRQRAPQAFRADVRRAVRAEDYNDASIRLPWVQRAGTAFRWTGSWTTIFVTADPKGSGAISAADHLELSQLLNRVRLAGYEVYAPAPDYVSFDLAIRVCARAAAFRADVAAALDSALRPVRSPDGHVGFFHFDRFTLNTPFERSRLEAAIQDVPGVAGVLSLQYRWRGHTSGFAELPEIVTFGPSQIFRLDNDANHPERGSYEITVEGGK